VGLFTRRTRGLQDVFPSSQRSISEPSVLDSTVYPSVFFPGPLARFDEILFEDISGANGDDQVAGSVVPLDKVRHILYCDTFHTDGATNQSLEFALAGPAFINPITMAQSDAGGGVFFGAGVFLVPGNSPWSLNNAMPRGIMVPPGWRIQANARPGIGIAAQIQIRVRWIDYPLSDLPHW